MPITPPSPSIAAGIPTETRSDLLAPASVGSVLKEIGRAVLLWAIVGCAYGLFVLLTRAVNDIPFSTATFVSSSSSFLSTAFLNPIFRRMVPRWITWGMGGRTALTVAAIFVGWHVGAVAFDAVTAEAINDLFSVDQPPTPFVTRMMFGTFNSVIMFVLVGGAYAAFAYKDWLVQRERHAAGLQAELARAQVSVLRMQLNPHFLFNALNGIAGMIPERPADAQEAIAELSDLLRGALKTPAEGATLADEVAWLRGYLDLQGLRFEDRLDVRLDVPDDLLDARVPGFLLQPLVENAFEHGIAQVTRPGEVAVRARRDGGRLVLDVLDNGPGLAGGDGQDGGLGVATTRTRLSRTYGADASLELSDRADGPGALARVTLPLTTAASHV